MSDTQTATTWGELAQPIRDGDPGPGKPPWKDNAFLVFWDPASEVYGVVHVSTSPNAAGRRARASFSVGGHTAEIAEELAPGSFTSESISFGLDGHITVTAPGIAADLQLGLRGRYCDYTVSGIIPALVEGEPLQHFQGAVSVTGSVALAAAEGEVNGAGMRDRTWGYRDESAQLPEYYGVIIDIDGRLLTIMKYLRPGGGTMTAGFILGDGDPVQANEISGFTRDASGLFAAARITTATGEILDLRVTRRRAGFWVPMGWERQGPTMSAYDELVEVRTGDGRLGHGLVEQGIVKQLC